MEDSQSYYLITKYKNDVPVKIVESEKIAQSVVQKLNIRRRFRVFFYQEVDLYLLNFYANQYPPIYRPDIFDYERFFKESTEHEDTMQKTISPAKIIIPV